MIALCDWEQFSQVMVYAHTSTGVIFVTQNIRNFHARVKLRVILCDSDFGKLHIPYNLFLPNLCITVLMTHTVYVT